MDTKLKNSKTGIITKVIAFVLMVIMVFSSSFMLFNAVTLCMPRFGGTADAVADIISSKTSSRKLFWRTSVIADDLRTDTVYLYLYAKYFSDEAAVNDGTAFAKLEADIKAPLEEKIQHDINEAWSDLRYSARSELFNIIWDSNRSSKHQRNFELFLKQYPDLDINTIESRDDLTLEMVNWYIENCIDNKPNEAAIRKQDEESYNKTVTQAKRNFLSVYRTVTERVNKLTALQYVIVLPDGKRLTNLPNGANISEDKLNEKVINSDFGYSCSEKFGLMMTDTTDSGLGNYPLITNSYYYPYRYFANNFAEALELLGINIYNFENSETQDYAYGMFRQNSMNFYLFSSGDFKDGTDGYCEKYSKHLNTYDDFIPAFIMLGIAFIILILLIIFSGSKNEDGSYRKAKSDKIYNDLHFIISAFFAILAGCIPAIIGDSLTPENTKIAFIGSAVGVALCWTIVTEWLMSVSRQIKAKTIFKHTSVWAFCRFIKRKVKSSTSKTKNKLRNKLSFFLKHRVTELRRDIWLFVALFIIGNLTISYFIGVLYLTERAATFFCVMLLIIYNVAVGLFIWKSVIALDSMMKAVSAAEQGNLNVTLNIGSMPRWIRKFAQDVQDMQNGMRAAVQEAIKGERMKTELITNVSHDLKTPLTSIVTYVDLLKKRPIDDKDALEYITVLDEKSARLKHLIEDLVEASKTTTGNVELHPVKINLYELALQSVGENEDALNAQGLEVRLSAQPEKPIVVYADNQKTWRIIENLISNVRKYAMSGTRVYISIEEKGGFGVFSVKNITREPIDVPASELTARFVRGDSSRSTEGSGLGLSIASNLCGLQGGKLDLTIDGDLFKATVYLPIAK